MAVDNRGNIYIADTQDNRVVMLTQSGGKTTSCTVDFSLLCPEGVAVDAHGTVYVADTEHRRAVKDTLSAGVYNKSFVGPGASFPVARLRISCIYIVLFNHNSCWSPESDVRDINERSS